MNFMAGLMWKGVSAATAMVLDPEPLLNGMMIPRPVKATRI
jgi:hypothetical protein